MEAKIITITPHGKKVDSSGWHTATLKAFDSYDDVVNDKPKYERVIDSFSTSDMLKFDESSWPTIEPTFK